MKKKMYVAPATDLVQVANMGFLMASPLPPEPAPRKRNFSGVQ